MQGSFPCENHCHAGIIPVQESFPCRNSSHEGIVPGQGLLPYRDRSQTRIVPGRADRMSQLCHAHHRFQSPSSASSDQLTLSVLYILFTSSFARGILPCQLGRLVFFFFFFLKEGFASFKTSTPTAFWCNNSSVERAPREPPEGVC